MVITGAPELPEEELVPSVDFYWYATLEDFDEEGNLSLEITSRRLRHRWVPKNKTAAKNLLREHEDATGLRSKGPMKALLEYSRKT